MTVQHVSRIRLPKYVYHGSMVSRVPVFKKKLLDSSFWRATDRDFGAAFYTTISFDQAAVWAKEFEKKHEGQIGCILKIELLYDKFPEDLSHSLVFLSDTHPDWVNFIVDHRLECDDKGVDPCGRKNHPPLVIGPMADNRMNRVHAEYNKLKSGIADKYSWYYDRITSNEDDNKLDSLALGNQIAFCEEWFNEMLEIKSHFVFDVKERKWIEDAYNKDAV